MSKTYQGRCHCGAVSVAFSSDIPPAEAEVRECQCSFCRLHGARATSDPDGRLVFTEHEPDTLKRYAFGLKTADFLVCSRCGVYIGIQLTAGAPVGIVNINTLDDRALFTAEPITADYDYEDTAGRIARREAKWTPTEIIT